MLKELLKDEILNGRFWQKAWSLIDGCTPISPGCAHCWLASMARRFSPELNNFKGAFNGVVVTREDRLDIPLHRRKPTVYAVRSDLFHESISTEFRDKAFAVMALSRHHRFIIVTKRPQIAAEYAAFRARDSWQLADHIDRLWPNRGADCCFPFSNVNILVTMEDQQRADERAPYAIQLASMDWTVGALCEPLLGSIDLSDLLLEATGNFRTYKGKRQFEMKTTGYLKWLITGGESGPGARPVHPDWVRSLRDQAQAAGVPFLLKHIDKKHGRLLDEQEHDEVPEI